jgi:hypothetical protein
MNISIEVNTDEINNNEGHQFKFLTISFDVYGNLYLHENDESIKAYQLNISGKNIPYFDFGDYNMINKYTEKLKTFVVLDETNSLKTKIKMKIEKEHNEYEEYDYNSDDEYDLDGDKNIDYYPEDNDHLNNEEIINNSEDECDEIDEENIKNYGYDNRKFIFWNNTHEHQMLIFNRKNGDVMALYDVYIYNDGKLIFKSNSPDNTSIYRFRINIGNNNDIYFRPIGYSEKKLRLKLNKDNVLTFIEST